MIYFDNGATTFPKPPRVIEQMKRCMLTYGGNPGRGAHRAAAKAAEKIFECRGMCAKMFGAQDEGRVFFTPNTTYGINAVLKGILKQGDHVLISDLEHNAVFRPVYKLAKEGKIEYDIFPTFITEEDREGKMCRAIEGMIRPNTRLLVCLHASNICSAVLPIARIGEICHRHGILFVLDGAQSAGHEHINMKEMFIDALCLPGHKGLYGPQGSGAVVLGEDIVLDTTVEGGNGIESLNPEMALWTPERYEAGTLATPNIVGLCEGLRFVEERGVEDIKRAERALCERLYDMLGGVGGIEIYEPWDMGSIFLFNVTGVPSEIVAEELDKHGVCVRGGYHCAALAHRTLGTPEGGAVRVSFGAYNTVAEVDAFCRILKKDII